MMRKKRWIIFAVVLALATLGYGIFSTVGPYGYCRGWWGEWGKENLLMRALWLCRCSPEFEQSLYPENIDVLVSACECAEDHPNAQTVSGQKCSATKVYPAPGGNSLLVEDELLDLYTYQRTPFVLPPGARFTNWLTDELIVIAMMGRDYIYDLNEQTSEPLSHITTQRMDSLDTFIQQAMAAEQINLISDQVYLLRIGGNFGQNFIYGEGQLPEGVEKTFGDILEENLIPYTPVRDKYTDMPPESPNGALFAEDDGVYDAAKNKLIDYGLPRWSGRQVRSGRDSMIISGYYGFYPELWRSDSKAIVLEEFRHALITGEHPIYVVVDFLPGLTEWGGSAKIYVDFPQPVLLFKLPDE